MELGLDLQKKIQLVLGRKVLPEDCGNVELFSSFSESDVADIRVLGQKAAYWQYPTFVIGCRAMWSWIVQCHIMALSFSTVRLWKSG
ncbi:protein of unknown function [Ralstonia solanacearum CMR15]|nr:protein of unknown function [Ralstonia solanacearum CMR15]